MFKLEFPVVFTEQHPKTGSSRKTQSEDLDGQIGESHALN